MSLEQLLQTAPTKKNDNKPVSPTLMIGLGGTGKEVLLRLRRLVVERYGSLSALPFLRYVHVDTDTTTNAREQYDLPASADPLFEAVRFRPSERIDLTIEGGTGKYVNHLSTYPHIKRWFPHTGKIANLGDLGDGAGQIRLASRLGLYHAPNFQKVTSTLEHARNSLSDPRILGQSAELGFDFEPGNVDIFIICSLAGGTGGGTFLDMGFLLKQYFANASTVGILLLPSFFTSYAGGKRVQANGYAALMELNHHSFGNGFEANWDGNRSEIVAPPPFDVTYLVDGANEAGLSIPSGGGEMNAYRMIAEVLFQDYAQGSFAGKKRATRVNLVNFALDVYSHNYLNRTLSSRGQSRERHVIGDTFPTRFGSFGYSAIEFPTDRVHTACGARLATEILDFWQKTLLDDPLERLLTRFLNQEDVRFVQGRYERRDGGGVIDRVDVEDALEVYEEGGGRTFPSFLWEKAQKIRHLLEATPNSQRATVLERELGELDRLFAHEDSDDPDEWGMGVRQIESNKRNYMERLTAGIEKQAEKTANDSKHGVAYTLSLLRELKSLLRSENFLYQGHFDSQIEVWRDETQAYGYDLDQLKLDIARHESEWLFRGHHLKWDFELLVGTGKGAPPGALYQYYFSRVKKQVAKRGKAICEEIDRFLGKDDATGEGLLARYWKLLSGFAKLQHLLRDKQEYFAQLQPSALVVSLYQESDCDTWYRRWCGEGERHRRTLEQVGNQLLQEVFKVDSVTAAMAQISKTPTDQLEGRILARCKEVFATQEKQPEALELLQDKRWDGERERMIKRAYDLAKVWLSPAKTGLSHIDTRPVVADQRPCLIGVDKDNELRFADFQRQISEVRSPADSPPSFQNLGKGNRGTILFYNELAGVAAFYSEAITRPGGLRSAYADHKEKDELHFDKNRFQFGDLVPKTDEEARKLADSIRAFVLARVLGLFKVKNLEEEDSEQVVSYYSYVRGGMLDAEDIQLGTEAQAIDALYRDGREEHRTDRRQLLEAVEESIQLLRSAGLLWAYWLLLDFYLHLVYPPMRDDKWVSNMTVVRYSPEHAVLATARDQVRTMLPTKEETTKLENALNARRRGKQGEELTYEDYQTALAGHVVAAGKFEVQSQSLVVQKRAYLDALALDPERLRGPSKDWSEAPAPSPEPPVQGRSRPCPNCSKEIDIRATYCLHCNQHVAQGLSCSICGSRVPDDLDECWSCGNQMRSEPKLDCPQCHSWSGYQDQFPCPECGSSWELAEPIAPPSPPPSGSRAGDEASSTSSSDEPPISSSPEPPEKPSEEPAKEPEAPAQVECPTCYSMVDAGPKCPVCDGLL
ncbi:MAG: hypothetical protein K0U98_05605 [Deltaproteobacteria bacterium]|nr:hypothetical protein [Deltaproteobacteria bacterium]